MACLLKWSHLYPYVGFGGLFKTYIESNFSYDLNKTLEEIQKRSNDLARQRAEFRRTGIETDGYMNMSNAALSCPMAIMAFLMGNNYEECIRYSLAMLGDSDSIACMVGSISAQVYGIPQELIDDALVYLPVEMVDVLNKFEGNIFVSRGITPPEIGKWRPEGEIIVYGSGPEENEKGYKETVYSRFYKYPRKGYAIPTIGKSLNQDLRFHVRPLGYDIAGYTVEEIVEQLKY